MAEQKSPARFSARLGMEIDMSKGNCVCDYSADGGCGGDYSRYIAVTDRSLVRGYEEGGLWQPFLEQIRRVAELRPHALILREKDLDRAVYEELAKRVRIICDEFCVPMYVHGGVMYKNRETLYLTGDAAHANDDELYALGADIQVQGNVHFPFAMLRDIYEREPESLSNAASISISCHSLNDAEEAVRMGARQIIVGNIYETQCKAGLPGKGLEFLGDICSCVHALNADARVYAIGGIKPDNIGDVMRAGADGGCMMSWFMRSLQ